MKGITKEFPGVRALDEVTLEVRRGTIHAICGENGAGKSTLMKVLSGVYPYGEYNGEIFYQGEKMKFRNIKGLGSNRVMRSQWLIVCFRLIVVDLQPDRLTIV